MPSSFVKRLFCRWMKDSRYLFSVNPYIEKCKRKHFVVKFAGVTSQISCLIKQSGQIEVLGQRKEDRELVDIVADFDIEEALTAEGQYYCKSCLDPQLYDSREALWIEHSFKPLAEWTRENLTDSTMLCFYKMPSHSCWVKLVPENTFEKYRQEEYFVAAVPVIERKIR